MSFQITPKRWSPKPSKYDPVFNESYLEGARHYEVTILPARPRKPRDKAWTTDYTSWWIGNEPVMELNNPGFLGDPVT